ncbi:formate dehydrogenase subunit delta [Metapseudomonas furukawaii]|jgi:formate dehydrogenase subunit delta|uniref:NAD-dependent formate dehydrogenase delta subunit n=1 Tax=Metapseudomonas furukawaii TaxID=1149133 RepID=A0AAD1BVC6_METFU|nr:MULTISPECIES: formate dehydrogenase subunit delta [Pseudomonas]ELS28028.1 NAD-dependent formate dehydrogenase delta subunit [Pseudomonas furukawaii]OWJ91783.1 formate dehydrogenase [Pseudomonas sp. A46]WAG79484.1 formate dehydrogenase subunit delta [Pseudomonas furukawaii]BAU72061.1 NAD-dependent formate dehydrogenase delta subunit [Pseudomonas furukawaii]
MSTDNLIKMANQIAQFFATEPDREQAVKGVQQHLQSFWTPAMRIELMAWQVEHHGECLHPLVQAALAEQGRAV